MKVIAVLVTYRPNFELLENTLESISSQVNSVVIVNNGNDEIFIKHSNVNIIQLGDNYGIAYAQNVGIRKAIEQKADFVLISDQDTVYPENYIMGFMKYIMNNKASVYCPVFYDNVKNVYSPIMIEKFKALDKIEEPTYVEHAISSGTLIDTTIFGDVGLMDEDLFIDYVDFEWCWRAVSKGYRIVTVPDIIINHQLGDGVKKIFNKQVTLRSDIRYFYILRNGFYLSKYCEYLNKVEKKLLLKRTISFSFGVILLRHNIKILRIVLKAFSNASKKKLGKMEL